MAKFQKGVSGNPGGRAVRVGPNGETLVKMARCLTQQALDTVKEVMLSKTTEPKDRLTAAFGLLDRGWGKPKESVDVDAKIEGAGVPIIQIVRYADPDAG